MNQPLAYLSLATLLVATAAHAQSAWLPDAQQIVAIPAFTYSSFDEFWMGDTKVSPLKDGDESLRQYSGFVALEYGITSKLAADATIGYAATSSTTVLGSGDKGLMDTNLGLRYQVLNGQGPDAGFLPTVSFRLGGIIVGDYDANTPFSIGDGASGIEISTLLAKEFSCGFGAFGSFGYRYRVDPVLADLFGSAGIYQRLGGFTLSFTYWNTSALNGLDIGGPGFNPGAGSDSGFPALKEVNQIITGGVGYTDKGGRNYLITVGNNVAGRNTGDKFIVGAFISLPFGP